MFSRDDMNMEFSGVEQSSRLTSVLPGMVIDLSSNVEQLQLPPGMSEIYCGISNILAVADASDYISEVTELNNAMAKEVLIDCINGNKNHIVFRI